MTFELPSWWKVAAFTINLLCGLVLSQLLGAVLEEGVYKATAEVVHMFTMWALSFIMVNVGYEFTVDKKDLAQYVWDYLIAMTAAGFPWLFVAVWFLLLIEGMKLDQAFLVARFAAPTSAGILFSMLEGAGLKDTWVFSKARVLAIFDDLDTILLMIPLKVLMVGFKWELLVVVGIMIILLALAWVYLHRLQLPHSSMWTIVYGGIVTAFCYTLYKVTKYHLPMEGIHIEVLLPAFVWGCMIDTPCARHELGVQRKASLVRKATLRLQELGLGDALFAEKTPVEEFEGGGEKEVDLENASKPEEGDKDLKVVHPNGARDVSRAPSLEVMPPAWVEEEAKLAEEPKAPEAEDTDAVFLFEAEKTSQEGEKALRVPERSEERRSSKGSNASRLSRHGHNKDEFQDDEHESEFEANVQTTISMVFMVLVGLSMPPLIGKNAKGDTSMDAGLILAHVVVVSILMIIGKMFPVFCYRTEVGLKERLALCLGMCPRGEVGASIIVISLELGVEGPAVIISMCALVINLVLSGGFIGAVKVLLRTVPKKVAPKLEDLQRMIEKAEG